MDINKIENANKAQLVDLLTTLEDSNQSGKELENVAAKYFHKNLHQPDKQELFQVWTFNILIYLQLVPVNLG